MCPYASCNDCCIVHSTSAGADPELVGDGGGGWSCMFLLHPVPICADAGPDFCTLFLRWYSPATTYGGGVSLSAIGTNTPLAPTVVSTIATCTSDVNSSIHRCRYQTYTRATCTVRWYVHIYMCTQGIWVGLIIPIPINIKGCTICCEYCAAIMQRLACTPVVVYSPSRVAIILVHA